MHIFKVHLGKNNILPNEFINKLLMKGEWLREEHIRMEICVCRHLEVIMRAEIYVVFSGG